jgi:RNA polymerase sigma-70 factor (ECF subfamily)
MVNNQLIDDMALVENISRQDEGALVMLYDRYAKSVFNVAYYVLQNRTLAEEITQDVFFLIWQYPHKWNPTKGKLGSWLLSVTRYMSIDRLRHEKSRSPNAPASLEDLAEQISSKVAFTALEDTTLLRSLLKRLPKDQREVLLLTYFRGMTHVEIAEHLKVPEGTIKSRLRLSLEKLREWWHEAVNEHQ